MMLNVQFSRFGGVMVCVVRVAVCRVRVVSGGFVVTCFIMPGGFAMVSGRVVVVLGCLVMVLCCLFRHGRPLLCCQN